MAIINWREEYETGVQEMDQQHKVLLEMINELYEIVRDHKGDGQLESILQKLSDYCQEHLAREEALLQEHDYPELDEQLQNHQEFTEELNRLRAELEAQDHAVAPEIYKFLRHWWLGHIVGIDRKYGSFLNEKGIE